MKFIIQIVALLAAFLAGAIWENQAYAQTTYLYGAQGQSLGTASQYGSTTYYYGPTGQSQGTASQYGNTTYYYGPTGQAMGTVTAPVAPINTPVPMYTPSTPSYNYNPSYRR
jgi:hypothetical protein